MGSEHEVQQLALGIVHRGPSKGDAIGYLAYEVIIGAGRRRNIAGIGAASANEGSMPEVVEELAGKESVHA